MKRKKERRSWVELPGPGRSPRAPRQTRFSVSPPPPGGQTRPGPQPVPSAPLTSNPCSARPEPSPSCGSGGTRPAPSPDAHSSPPGGRRQAAKGEGLRAAAKVREVWKGAGGGGGDAPHTEQAEVPPRSMTVGPRPGRPTEAAGAGRRGPGTGIPAPSAGGGGGDGDSAPAARTVTDAAAVPPM